MVLKAHSRGAATRTTLLQFGERSTHGANERTSRRPRSRARCPYLRMGLRSNMSTLSPVKTEGDLGRCAPDFEGYFEEGDTLDEWCSRRSEEERDKLALISLVGPGVDQRLGGDTNWLRRDFINAEWWVMRAETRYDYEKIPEEYKLRLSNIWDNAIGLSQSRRTGRLSKRLPKPCWSVRRSTMTRWCGSWVRCPPRSSSSPKL